LFPFSEVPHGKEEGEEEGLEEEGHQEEARHKEVGGL
jgi:hypothetical protein